MSLRLIAACFCFPFAVAALAHEAIPILGLDDSGQEVSGYVARERYTRGLAKMMAAVSEETLSTLDNSPAGRRWKIRTVYLGVGLGIKVGFPPFFELGIAPRFDVSFSDGNVPLICGNQ